MHDHKLGGFERRLCGRQTRHRIQSGEPHGPDAPFLRRAPDFAGAQGTFGTGHIAGIGVGAQAHIKRAASVAAGQQRQQPTVRFAHFARQRRQCAQRLDERRPNTTRLGPVDDDAVFGLKEGLGGSFDARRADPRRLCQTLRGEVEDRLPQLVEATGLHRQPLGAHFNQNSPQQRTSERHFAACLVAQHGTRRPLEFRWAQARHDEFRSSLGHAAQPQQVEWRFLFGIGSHHQHRRATAQTPQVRTLPNPQDRAQFIVVALIRRARGVVEVVAPQLFPEEFLEGVEIFVAQTRCGKPRNRLSTVGALDGVQFFRHQAQGFVPTRLNQPLALANKRRRQAGAVADKTLPKAPLVAEPDLVNRLILPWHHAHHLVVAHIQRQVAADRTKRADRRFGRYFPHPGFEAEVGTGERAHRTNVGRVARKLTRKRRFAPRDNHPLAPAIGETEHRIVGQFILKAHTARTEDAALTVKQDQVAQRDRFLEMEFVVIIETTLRRPPLHRQVLQRTLAALIADRTIERVRGQQKLKHAALGKFHFGRRSVDHHTLADGRGAAGLELRHHRQDRLPVRGEHRLACGRIHLWRANLHQTHPAHPHRLQLRVIAEDRNVNPAHACSVHHGGTRRDGDANSINGYGDSRHGATFPSLRFQVLGFRFQVERIRKACVAQDCKVPTNLVLDCRLCPRSQQSKT